MGQDGRMAERDLVRWAPDDQIALFDKLHGIIHNEKRF